MRRWEELENYLAASGNPWFTSTMLATDLGITRAEASAMVQAHLIAQRGARSQTLHVIYRTGRTSAAIWHAGGRVIDARKINAQLVDDLRVRVIDAIEIDLHRMGILNPRTAPIAAAISNAILANLQLMAASVP